LECSFDDPGLRRNPNLKAGFTKRNAEHDAALAANSSKANGVVKRDLCIGIDDPFATTQDERVRLG